MLPVLWSNLLDFGEETRSIHYKKILRVSTSNARADRLTIMFGDVS